MATAKGSSGRDVRLNDLDWELLEIMGDEERYTPQHIYDDVLGAPDFETGWLRQRIRNLAEAGLISKVGTSRMYRINSWGLAALEIRDEYEDSSPQEFSRMVIQHADRQSSDDAST